MFRSICIDGKVILITIRTGYSVYPNIERKESINFVKLILS